MAKAAARAAVIVAALLTATGCAQSVPGTATGPGPAASADRAVDTAKDATTAPTTTTTAPSSTPSPSPTPAAPVCGPDLDTAIAAAIAGTPPDPTFSDIPWQFFGDTDYDPCAELSYARLELGGGTASSPMHLALFHRGEYTGTATWCAFAYTDVLASDGKRIDVRYRWPRAGDTNADPTGEAYTAFVRTGDSVTMTADLPGELLTVSGCS